MKDTRITLKNGNSFTVLGGNFDTNGNFRYKKDRINDDGVYIDDFYVIPSSNIAEVVFLGNKIKPKTL